MEGENRKEMNEVGEGERGIGVWERGGEKVGRDKEMVVKVWKSNKEREVAVIIKRQTCDSFCMVLTIDR